MKTKKRAYVIGNNTKTSVSPDIFNFWFKKYKIDAEYKYKQTNNTNFKKDINKILEDKSLCGVNITIPFKERAISLCTTLTAPAKKIGAVNCISVKKNGAIIGSNSDWFGFEKSIKGPSTKLKNNSAIVIGYGGAAKAIVYSLKKNKFKKIKLFNRSYDKIKNLPKNKRIETYSLEKIKEHVSEADIIINTTPVNILKKTNKINIHKKTVGFDVVYRPKDGTGFLKHFNHQKRIEGIYMLVYQAIPCFKDWFGIEPVADKALFQSLFKKINKKK